MSLLQSDVNVICDKQELAAMQTKQKLTTTMSMSTRCSEETQMKSAKMPT
jgi:hypothetical protein